MTATDKIAAAILLLFVISFIALAVYGWIRRHSGVKEGPQPDIVKVQDIPIGHAIYDLFPEWRKEFDGDPAMEEIAATCDLYLAARDLLKGGTRDAKLIVSLDDAVHKFEKYVL